MLLKLITIWTSSIKVASHEIRFGLLLLHFSTVEYSMKVTEGSWYEAATTIMQIAAKIKKYSSF